MVCSSAIHVFRVDLYQPRILGRDLADRKEDRVSRAAGCPHAAADEAVPGQLDRVVHQHGSFDSHHAEITAVPPTALLRLAIEL